jgi:hypothetical protein
MPTHFSAEEVLAILIGIAAGGRGGHNPENPILGIPSFGDALAEDRARGKGKKAARSRSTGFRLRVPTKKKRKVSAYQKAFGRQLKKLKRKHPRTPVQKLMKRAHTATRKERRGK